MLVLYKFTSIIVFLRAINPLKFNNRAGNHDNTTSVKLVAGDSPADRAEKHTLHVPQYLEQCLK